MSLDSLISQIRNDKMNDICFDCGEKNPVFISINNGIFLCAQCATIHMSFQPGVSTVENNDLHALSVNELSFIAKGGNTRLNDFILEEFPKLENYSQKLLYKTRAMDYYRKRLNYLVNGGPEPTRPSQIAGCQLIPDNFYSQNSYVRNAPKKFEPKTRTYKPNQTNQGSKFKFSPESIANDYNEDNFFGNPFLDENKFEKNEGNMFKKFFGDDFGFDDDDFFGGPKKKLNQTQIYKDPPKYEEKPKTVYNNVRQPQDNVSKRNAQTNTQQPPKRPITSSNPIFVPSRKHKYIKKEEQNNNNSNNNNNNSNNNFSNSNYTRSSYSSSNNNNTNYTKNNTNNNYTKNTTNNSNTKNTTNNSNTNNNYSRKYYTSNKITNDNNTDNNNNVGKKLNVVRNAMEEPNKFSNINNENKNNSDKYNPFKRRDSTELITLPNLENNNLAQNKKNQKKQEIPLEFHRQATGLGQIADAVNENDEDSLSEKSENSKSDNDSDYSAELAKIPENNTHKQQKDVFDENQITFKNSIRNKYKKKKSEQIMENLKNEEKLKNSRANNIKKNNVYESKHSNSGKKENDNNNYNKKPSNKIENNPQFDKKYARRLSKIKITSTNWNINQLGDKNIYPDAMEVEG